MAKEWAKAFYKSGPWRRLRVEVLHRDMFTCEVCGARATEVHHEIELTPENITDAAVALNHSLLHSLCHDCHTQITKGDADCDDGYYFDEAGQLTPREGDKTGRQDGDRREAIPKHAPGASIRGG